jgi:hypothetical protein
MNVYHSKKMKEIHLGHMVENQLYYIQRGNNKFKAVYDRYEKNKWFFKKIIRLNTPHNWCGHIGFFEHLNYTVYESQKTKIQTEMETRAIKTILIDITGTEIY